LPFLFIFLFIFGLFVFFSKLLNKFFYDFFRLLKRHLIEFIFQLDSSD